MWRKSTDSSGTKSTNPLVVIKSMFANFIASFGSNPGISIEEVIPDELLFHISSQISSPQDLLRLNEVSTRIHELTNLPVLWQAFGFQSKEEFISAQKAVVHFYEAEKPKVVVFGPTHSQPERTKFIREIFAELGQRDLSIFLGIDFSLAKINNKEYQLWPLAGQTNLDSSTTKVYLKGTHVLLIFPDSVDNAKTLREKLKVLCDEPTPIMFIFAKGELYKSLVATKEFSTFYLVNTEGKTPCSAFKEVLAKLEDVEPKEEARKSSEKSPKV